MFPIDLPGPDALADYVGGLDVADIVVTIEAGDDPAPWSEAGATWCLTGFGPTPTEAEVRAAIDAL